MHETMRECAGLHFGSARKMEMKTSAPPVVSTYTHTNTYLTHGKTSRTGQRTNSSFTNSLFERVCYHKFQTVAKLPCYPQIPNKNHPEQKFFVAHFLFHIPMKINLNLGLVEMFYNSITLNLSADWYE